MPPKRRLRAKAPKEVVHPALEEPEDGSELTLEEAKNLIAELKETKNRVAELEEQLRLMSLGNQTQNQDVNNPPANPTRNPVRNRAVSEAISSPVGRKVRRGSASAVKKDINSGCSCTGNCATKRCGCVKKDKVCNEFCKCADACQNQGNAADDSDNDDKENENENVQVSKNVDVKSRGKKTVPFTPKVQTKKTRRANVISDSSIEGTPSPVETVEPRSLFDTPVVENKPNNESFSSYESNEAEEQVPINPMKPKHQLLRSPVVRSPVVTRNRSKSPNPAADHVRDDDSDDDDDYNENGLANSKAETSSSSQSSSASTNPLQPKHKLLRSPVDRKIFTRSQSKSPNPPADRVRNNDDDESLIPKAETSSSSQSFLSVADPLKPKHKLMRSPLPGTSTAGSSKSPNMLSNTSVFHDDDVFLPVPKPDLAELSTSLPPPPEIFEEEVDWSEHKSKLVKCRKCQRNFFPYRIAVHEKNCIKI